MDNIWFASKRDGAALHMMTVEELPRSFRRAATRSKRKRSKQPIAWDR